MDSARMILIVTLLYAVGIAVPYQEVSAADISPPLPGIVYTPPMRGAPKVRVGGGTRGNDHRPTIAAMAPDHAGLTTDKSPTLYWYISAPLPTGAHMELTLVHPEKEKPLLEARLPAPVTRGLQAISLADHRIILPPDVEVEWHVALVQDANDRSTDLLAGGVILRTSPPASLAEQLANTPPSRQAALIAAAGYWYDAFTLLSRQTTIHPGDADLHNMRRALLEQVGLEEQAKALGQDND